MLRVTQTVDKANGYIFGDTEERNIQDLMSYAMSAEFEYEKIASVTEKYMDCGGDKEDGAEGGAEGMNL